MFHTFVYENVLYLVVNPSDVESLPGIACIDPQDNYESHDMQKATWAMNACPKIVYMLKCYNTESAFLT